MQGYDVNSSDDNDLHNSQSESYIDIIHSQLMEDERFSSGEENI